MTRTRMSTETPSEYRKRLKKAIDKLFSEWVRRRSGGVCYTCEKPYDWKYEMNAGHYIHNKLDFDPMNRRAQCTRCNNSMSGNLGIFGEKLIAEYGLEKIQEMRTRANLIWKPSTQELEDLLAHWTAEVEKINKGS